MLNDKERKEYVRYHMKYGKVDTALYETHKRAEKAEAEAALWKEIADKLDAHNDKIEQENTELEVELAKANKSANRWYGAAMGVGCVPLVKHKELEAERDRLQEELQKTESPKHGLAADIMFGACDQEPHVLPSLLEGNLNELLGYIERNERLERSDDYRKLIAEIVQRQSEQEPHNG